MERSDHAAAREDATRRRGRPKMRWLDEGSTDLRKMGINEWMNRARDQEAWRRIVRRPRPTPGCSAIEEEELVVSIMLITVLLLVQHNDLPKTKITYSCYSQSEGTAALILDLRSRWKSVVKLKHRPLYHRTNSRADAHRTGATLPSGKQSRRRPLHTEPDMLQ